MEQIIYGIIGLIIGAGGIFFILSAKYKTDSEAAQKEKERLEKEALQRKDQILEDARKQSMRLQEEARKEEQERKKQIEKLEERLHKREEVIDEKYAKIEEIKGQLDNDKQAIERERADVKKLEDKTREELQTIAGLNKDEAKEILLTKYESEFEKDILVRVRKLEERHVEEADKKARNIIGTAIQKYANEVASETMSTIVTLPDDDMKGRIIGREGRNINALERLTGIDIIVDDTPGTILISGFDLMRRFIAKKSLEILLEDGRIHPARIEEVVEKVRRETDDLMKEFGEKALMELGITGIHPNLVKLVGRMRFRTSYGQNILKHSMEVAYICAQLAQEIGADIKLAKQAGFFHDIGKAVTHEIEGPHAVIGGVILRKFNVDEKLINCVESHHNDFEQKSIEAVLVTAADAISGARPGARSDTVENYIKRLQDLENVASSFEGVNAVHAIQAGREVRVFVDPDEITDLEALKLAQNIARKVEDELQYPGEVKINLIRESRVIEFAR